MRCCRKQAEMNGKAKLAANGHKTSVYGGQAFKKAVFPPTSYIQGLLNAYCPDLHFNPVSRPYIFFI
jgi:hypothetical protein